MKTVLKVLVLCLGLGFALQAHTQQLRLMGAHMAHYASTSYYYIQHAADEKITDVSWSVSEARSWSPMNDEKTIIEVTWKSSPGMIITPPRRVTLNSFKVNGVLQTGSSINVILCGITGGNFYSNTNTLAKFGNATNIVNEALNINGTFTLNTSGGLKFTNCTFFFDANSKIVTTNYCPVTFENCKFYMKSGSSIDAVAANARLEFYKCNFEGNENQIWMGLRFYNSNGFSVEQCRIINVASAIDFTLNGSSLNGNITIKNNLIETYSRTYYSGSIDLRNFSTSQTIDISKNILLISNQGGYGIYLWVMSGSGKLNITNNNIIGSNSTASMFLCGGEDINTNSLELRIDSNQITGYGISTFGTFKTINIRNNRMNSIKNLAIDIVAGNNMMSMEVSNNNIKMENGHIRFINCLGGNKIIANNYIEELSTSLSNYPDYSTFFIENTRNIHLVKNVIKSPRTGVYVTGDCTGSSFKCNALWNNAYGFYFENATISNQGNSGEPFGNAWYGNYAPGRKIAGSITNNATWYWASGTAQITDPQTGLPVLGTYDPSPITSPLDSKLTLKKTLDINCICQGGIVVNPIDPGIQPSPNAKSKLISSPDEILNLYPNPAKDIINIQNDGNATRLVIYDISGKQIFEGLLNQYENIQVNNWNSGVYIYHFLDEQNNILKTGKLQIVH